ncbi:unnamed protein product [Effrenium voratum]|uniref:Chloride channel protein n=1 Tax=Effrenium voratum TaxID=2562239 RepID=A0AA36JEF9_9DINO|nr:unnamed protein product [Effrenium voratum]CAJ1403483.1 unnamed protein product [Effrenium voratum]
MSEGDVVLTCRAMSRALSPPAKLPTCSAWMVVVLTAVGMALANLCTVFTIEFLVRFKFNTMQAALDRGGIAAGMFALMGLAATFATLGTAMVHGLAPDAGGSGAPENKGWLNGFNLSKMFTKRILAVRFVAVILSNATGYPCGREGPTVTMGSNLAFLLCRWVTKQHADAREWIDLQGGSPGALADEHFFARAVRVACIVGGACGMAMIFDSPLGGILYMFEEVTSASWPMELTFKAFVGCVICTSVSYALLAVAKKSIRDFVIFEMWYGPDSPDYSALDIPGFILVSGILGLLAPLHTKLCLSVVELRKQLHGGPLRKCQPWAKMLDTVIFAVLCAAAVAATSFAGLCTPVPEQQRELSYVRYQCPYGSYNPVASLLLTTAEGAVKILFSRENAQAFGAESSIALFTYFTMNVAFSGVPVPSGNFTGTMMIGGLAGRLIGHWLSQLFPDSGLARSGIYSMIGAAAMLSSFKQMTIAVVLFVNTASNNVELGPPLMLAVSVSLFMGKLLGSPKAWDEEQLLRKKVPFLEPEPCKEVRDLQAYDLLDEIPEESYLPPEPDISQVEKALQCCQAPFLPVVVGDTRPRPALQVPWLGTPHSAGSSAAHTNRRHPARDEIGRETWRDDWECCASFLFLRALRQSSNEGSLRGHSLWHLCGCHLQSRSRCSNSGAGIQAEREGRLAVRVGVESGCRRRFR